MEITVKDKTTAAILAFFLGGIGVHKFYLNQTGAGVIYLLFCWTGFPALIAFAEFIYFLVMSPAEFDRRYNQQMLPYQQPIAQLPAPQQMAQNITVNIPTQGDQPLATGSGQQDIVARLERLNELRLSGVLEEHEFQAQKRRLLETV